jgi:hypothetical protein
VLHGYGVAEQLAISGKIFVNPEEGGGRDRTEEKDRAVVLADEVRSSRRTARRYERIRMRRHHGLQKEEDASKCWEGLRWFLPLQAVSLLSKVGHRGLFWLGCRTAEIAVALDNAQRIPQLELRANGTGVL